MMEQMATPALETPIGHIVVIIVGLVLAFGMWQNRESVDLLFFRLSGGNTRVANFATIAVPVLTVAATCWIVIFFL